MAQPDILMPVGTNLALVPEPAFRYPTPDNIRDWVGLWPGLGIYRHTYPIKVQMVDLAWQQRDDIRHGFQFTWQKASPKYEDLYAQKLREDGEEGGYNPVVITHFRRVGLTNYFAPRPEFGYDNSLHIRLSLLLFA